MPDITMSVSMSIFKKFVFISLGLISKKLQSKYFPFNTDKVICKIENNPVITIYKDKSFAKVDFLLKFTNYNIYDIIILSIEGNFNLLRKTCGSIFFNRSRVIDLKKEYYEQYKLILSLTEFEVEMIKMSFEELSHIDSNIQIEISYFNTFGFNTIKLNFNLITELRFIE